MKNLQDILYKVRLTSVNGSTDMDVSSIVFDSRKIEENCVFVAVKGVSVDGHDFIKEAILKGATAVVCEDLPEKLSDHVTYVQVQDSADALAFMASNYYGNPSEEIKLIGITGTNGKTTTTTLLHELLTGLGIKSGLLSTVVNKIGTKEVPATHTTPNPVELNGLLRDMINEGCTHCFMEVSSHAIHQKRTAGLLFDIAGFTNISHDHLDYHHTFKDYIYAKKGLFDKLTSDAVAIINIDDQNAEVMVQNTSAKVKTFALKTPADYKVKIIENSFSGLVLNIDKQELWTNLIGDFNAYNLLLVYAICCELDMDEMEVLTEMSKLHAVEGRFEYIKSQSGVIAIVDYAHTPDALKNVLSTIESVRTRNEQLITVVGCGGDRDKTKRPVMASIAAKYSDQVILTSDNPRTEDPDQIIRDMQPGIPAEKTAKTMAITSRGEAIKVACSLAQPEDIVLVAGKGHETYQEINGVRHHFDDLETITETLKTLNK